MFRAGLTQTCDCKLQGNRIEPRWSRGTSPPPQNQVQVTQHMSTCDDRSVPYGVWLFSFFLELHLLPQRGCTESDINDCTTLVHSQKKSELSVGRWWCCLGMLSSAEGWPSNTLSVCLKAVHALCHALWLPDCVYEKSWLLLNADNFCYGSTKASQELETVTLI